MSFIRGYIRRLPEYLRTPLYKNAIFLMANTVAGSALGFFFWMVVARFYEPFEAGLAVVTLQAVVFLAMLSKLGFDVGLVRFLPSSGKNSRDLINSCFTISGAVVILVSIVFLAGLDIWAEKLGFIRENWIFLVSFILFSVVFVLLPLMNQVMVARRRAEFVLAGSLISGSRIAFPIFFAMLGFGAFGIFASWSVAMLITVIIGLLLFVPRVNPGYRPVPTVKKNVVSEMVHYSAGNYAAEIFGAAPSFLLPLVIVYVFSPQGLKIAGENVAYYYFALMIAALIFAITSAVCLSLFAEGSHFERELKSNVRKALKLIFVLLIPAVLFVLFFGNYLLLLFGEEYSAEGMALLQIFALSSIFMVFNNVFIATRRVLKRLRPVIAIPAFNAFVIVGLAYVLLNTMGLVGVAVAWALSQGIVSIGIGTFFATRYVFERHRAS
ncbi:MAG: lipopolysaccharide biosynthesis protein [Thermoplasmata archaeon]